MATCLEGSKNYFRLIIYSHSSTKPEHLAKIGPIDFEIIGLTAIVNNKYKITNRSRTYNPRACFQQPGGLKCQKT